MRGEVTFLFAGQRMAIADCAPTTTVLDWLRGPARRKGTKEGCAEGDCGACTVVVAELDADDRLQFQAINACILFLPMLDGKALFTVEDLADLDGTLHPVQQAMVEQHGSQCGFCTPGFVMSLFAAYQQERGAAPERAGIDRMLAGNLCRCTGYAPILRAAQQALVADRADPFTAQLEDLHKQLMTLRELDALCLDNEHGRFDAPRTATELAALLAEFPQARLVAGATDIGLWVTKQLRDLPHLVSTGRVQELLALGFDAQSEELRIGAAVTYSHAWHAITGLYPAFAPLLERLGGLQVRNSGTIGGNIANGSPIGDMPPALIALGARLVLTSAKGQRELACEDYFIAYGKQALAPGEFLEAILLPAPPSGMLFRSYKISKRFEQDISALCAAFALHIEDGRVDSARVAFGGMAATPKRAPLCEATLTGQAWTEHTVRAAMTALQDDYTPIDDHRASAAYRRQVAANLLLRCYLESCEPATAALPCKYDATSGSVHASA